MLDGVSFELAAGEALALLGRSGSGKTTLARCLIGLPPPEAATSGEILFDGRKLRTAGGAEWDAVRGKEIALVFQEPAAALDPVRPVGSAIAEALRPADRPSRGVRRRNVERMLAEVGLADPHVAREYPHRLSGGMRQRIAIAAALAGRPRLLVADEPTSALDPPARRGILELLDARRHELGLALLLITHDPAQAAAHSDRVAVLEGGRIARVSA